jgi:hypothetical protein
MKRYKPLFECEEGSCDNEECPCNESCSKKKEQCMCEDCPEGSKKNGAYCVGTRGEKLQNKCASGYIWDHKNNKCIPLGK